MSKTFILLREHQPSQQTPQTSLRGAPLGLCVFVFLVCSIGNIVAEEANDKTVYVIRSVEYQITGKTKEVALERAGGLKKGERITGVEALEAYRAEKQQALYNVRMLDGEKGSVEYTLGEAEEDGAVPVYLVVTVTDSSNRIIIPEPKYDSNSGLTLSLKARDYNFLGMLSPFKIDLVWGNDEKDRTSAGFLLDLIMPFRAAGLDWAFTAFNEFKYYLTGEPVYNKTAFGISMELPVSFTAFTFGYLQGFVLHEENTARITRTSVFDEYHDWYMYSKLYVDWKIPTPLQVGIFGKVVYTPGVYGAINYQPGGDVGDYRRGIRAGINQTVSFNRIDWIGNFRQGLNVSLFNVNEYNYFRQDWINSAGAKIEGYIRVFKLFGISGRLMYTKWWNDFYDYAGDVIRGYKDDELNGTRRLSLNVDFPFRLFRFVPSEWTGKRKYRYIDFEQHWSPFIDLVMLDSINEKDTFNVDSIIPGVGLEIITFPLAWRRFYIRASAGWDLKELIQTGKLPQGIHQEIYIGLGHYY
jgi:hypothetical protein